MLNQFFSEKWAETKLSFFSNSIEVITLVYVCFLCYVALCFYFKSDLEKVYPKIFVFSSAYVVIRLIGKVLLGVS